METPGLEIRRLKFLQKSGLKKLFAVSEFLFGKVILTGESDPYLFFTGTTPGRHIKDQQEEDPPGLILQAGKARSKGRKERVAKGSIATTPLSTYAQIGSA